MTFYIQQGSSWYFWIAYDISAELYERQKPLNLREIGYLGILRMRLA